jgi:hypothetical protein
MSEVARYSNLVMVHDVGSEFYISTHIDSPTYVNTALRHGRTVVGIPSKIV